MATTWQLASCSATASATAKTTCKTLKSVGAQFASTATTNTKMCVSIQQLAYGLAYADLTAKGAASRGRPHHHCASQVGELPAVPKLTSIKAVFEEWTVRTQSH